MNIFLCRKDFFYLVTFATIQFFSAPLSQAAKAPSSKQQLESIATHIVVGKVQAIYSYMERALILWSVRYKRFILTRSGKGFHW